MRIHLLECVKSTDTKKFGQVIDQYHSYVKYTQVPQRRINYLVLGDSGRILGAIGASSAVMSVAARDQKIGWDKTLRLAHLNSLANNYRFCLIPDSGVDNLGSMTLRIFRETLKRRWEEKYGDPLWALETYVEPNEGGGIGKFRRGSVYLADNWILVGKTKGNSIKKAPLKLWQREDTQRGELARTNPEEAVRRYASHGSGVMYNTCRSSVKLVFLRALDKRAHIKFLEPR